MLGKLIAVNGPRSTRIAAAGLCSALVFIALPAPVALAGPSAEASAKRVSTKKWKTLRKGKRRIKAPSGYKLVVRSGAYELRGKTAKLSIMGVRTKDSVRSVAEGLLGTGLSTYPSNKRIALRISLKGGKKGQVYFEKVSKGVSVVAVSPRGSRKSVSSTLRRTLGAAAGTARGLKLTSLKKTTTQTQEAAIPLKAFQTPDGTAKAQVPDADGWVASGQQGIVEGGHPTLGGYAFGVAVPFWEPSTFCFQPCSLMKATYMPAAQAVEQAWPVFLARAGVQASNIKVLSQIPGSAGVLGPGIDSGVFQFSATIGGIESVGFISAGTFRVSAENWYLYYSFVAAAKGASGAVGDALLRAWQSWDPSADQARRQRLTFIAQQETTQIIQQTTEYRRRVYEASNYNWVQLIRGKEPVLAPVDPSVIGEGGETLVRTTDGSLFDLEGNQFKEN